MSKKLSATEVLNKIGATDFRSISKDQLIAFVSSIPDMDKDVAIECIKQFPEFKEHATEIINQLSSLCLNAMDTNQDVVKESIKAYQLILDDLREQLKREDLNDEQRNIIIDKMVNIASCIAEIAREHTNFVQDIIHKAMYIAFGTIVIGGTILGVKTIGKK